MKRLDKVEKPATCVEEKRITLTFSEEEFLRCCFLWMSVLADSDERGVGGQMQKIISASPKLTQLYRSMLAATCLKERLIRALKKE